MGLHDEHRQRLKRQYMEHGADALTDLQLMELFLFYSIPRKDVNPVAHLLFQEFDSLPGVFDASIEELVTVPGIGEHVACSIHLLNDISRRCDIARNASDDSVITDWQSAGDFLLPFFYGALVENVYMLCLDARGRVLRCERLGEGNPTFAALDLRELIRVAMNRRAVSVVLAHNHPGGHPVPSQEDLQVTLEVRRALETIHVELLDHLIIADGQYVSLRRIGPPSLWN
ncbi:MAG: DNA repair protein RadC [Oscillospiraceae bacterium]|nr:DNA repair protein RadC [Oscillospiraceae bacterium]